MIALLFETVCYTFSFEADCLDSAVDIPILILKGVTGGSCFEVVWILLLVLAVELR